MTNFESYRNTIIYQDLDQYGYLDNSKIENIFETSEDFFFSLTNFKKKTLIKDTIIWHQQRYKIRNYKWH